MKNTNNLSHPCAHPDQAVKGNLPLFFLAAVTVALLVCGSLKDYEISRALYLGGLPTENLFGIVFAFIGVIPTFVGWSFLGASLFSLSKRNINDKKRRRPYRILSYVLFLLSFLFFCNTLQFVNDSFFFVSPFIAYPVGTLAVVGAAFGGYRLAEKSTVPHLWEKILVLTAVSLAVMVIVMSTKEIMCRPRFRFVEEAANPEYFRNWWQSGRDIKSALGTGISGDNFTSFPSGHAAYSMFAVFMFPAMADFIPSLKKKKPLLLVFGILWWALTSFSRITVGAHFLSDVAFSGLITLTVHFVVEAVTNRMKTAPEDKKRMSIPQN